MSGEGRNRPLFLVGFMGSGKSRIGRLVAGDTGWRFVDSDRWIEKTAGCSIREFFSSRGEKAFRALERQVVAEISALENVVVSLGGGVFEDAGNRARLMATGIVVWLDAPLHVIRSRLGRSSHRPLWPSDPEEQEALFRSRRTALALAPNRVDAGDRPPESVASDVLLLAGWKSCGEG